MTAIRDDLGNVVNDVLRDRLANGVVYTVPDVADDVTDAVLHWLGNLDPDCTPELLRWHIVNDRALIAEQRAEITKLRAAADRLELEAP